MWSAIRWLVLRLAAIRWLFKLGGLAFLIPIVMLLKAIGLPLLAVLSMRTLYDDIRFGETSPGIGVPQWWYTVWLPVLSVAIAGRALGLFIRRGRQP